ncbi:MAG: transketolase C-terminal domain-containing protein, partial [Actinomycetes bacterium]
LFEDLGLKYVGPVDGHSVEDLEFALRRAASFPGPVIVHALTEKGRGYLPAELDEADRFHGVGVIDPGTGRPVSPGAPSWTAVFSDELVKIGAADPSVVALTAAMLAPTGLDAFAQEFPERTFDSGIAEQHAATSAAGMAFAGLHPVVAVYSTFINRAFDQVLMDCALHSAAVTFVLDRAGVTGPDGPSHHGMWDLSILGIVPGMAIAAPRDGKRLRELLRAAVAITTGPSVVRFPSGPVPADLDAVETVGGVDILLRGDRPEVLLVAVGATAVLGLEVAQLAADQGVAVTVVDPRWVAPIAPGLVELARGSSLVVCVEDNIRTSGFGSQLTARLCEEDVRVPIKTIGLPAQFLPHGKRADVQQAAGLSAAHIAQVLVEAAHG